MIEFNFSSDGKLTSIVDRNGNTTTVSYDVNGFLSEVEDAGGRTLTFTTDASGRITGIEDPLERTVGFEYDDDGDLIEVTDVKGGITTYTYSNHRMTSLTDSNDHLQNENIYDGASRVVEQTDATGGKTCVYYGAPPSYTSAACPGVTPTPSAGQTVVVDPRGHKTTYDFDTRFRTTGVTDHDGEAISFEYDTDNNLTCVTDQRGNKTGYSYDSEGNVTEIIDALNTDANCELKSSGVSWTFAYTSLNDIETETDPLGRETVYVYGQDGNLTRVIRRDDVPAVQSLTCFERDGDGLVTAIVQSTDLVVPQGATDPCTGHETLFDYDNFGNQIEVVSPRFSGQQEPPVITMTYDLGGRLETITNELNETTTYTYDEQNNVFTVEDALGNITSNTYDAKGNLKTVTDANRQPVGAPETGEECGELGTGDGIDDDEDDVPDDGCPSVIYNYDEADRLIEVIDALGHRTTYGYDEMGNRVSVTKATRQPVGEPETGEECGALGTGDGIDDDEDDVPDDGCPSTIYEYDALNRLVSEIDALGRVTSYDYDEAGNLIERIDARGLVTEYTPDELNRVILIEYWDGETLVDDVTYTYDDVGNRLTMVDSTGATEYEYDALDRPISVTFPGDDTVAYEYDEVGNRVKLTYPDSKEADYAYDEAGNLETVTDWLDNTTTYTYDDAGRLINTDLPNNVDTDYTYDDAGRLTSVVNTGPGPSTISSFTYTLDAVGNRTQMVAPDGAHSYEYDPLYRLTGVTYPGPATDTYTYDAVGNRLTKNTDEYSYDAADQLLDLGSLTFAYDENGNQIERGTDTFEYDHENRLTASDIDSVSATYTYNGDGLRVTRTIDQASVSYIWDVAAGLPVIIQDSDGNTYVYGLDLISRTDSGGDQEYYLYDGLGSTTEVTDENGDVVASYSYDVFGTIRAQTGSSPNEFTFTGEQVDGMGLQYLRARYYDPTIGRFLSRDPFPGFLSDPATQHPYSYALNNPCSFTDPSGHLAKEAGFSVTICHALLKAEGIGRHRIGPWRGPTCIPWVTCPRLFEWDELTEMKVDAIIYNTPDLLPENCTSVNGDPPPGRAPVWARSKGRKEDQDAKVEVHGGADHRCSQGARGGDAGEGAGPAPGRGGGDAVPLEAQVRRHGGERGAAPARP